MIEFACPKCRRPLKIDDSAAGKKGRCKGCNAEIEVPAFNGVLEGFGPLSAGMLREIEQESERAENAPQPVDLPSDPTVFKDPTVAHLAKIEKLLEAMVERSRRPKEYKVSLSGTNS